MPRLIVVEPVMEDAQQSFELREKELSIGRTKDNTISLDREAVSSRHVELKWKDGDYEFKDLDSTNGTYHNGDKVKEGILRNGDVFQVADVVFAYESLVDPNDMEKLMKAEESSRQEKAWRIRRNLEARVASATKKLEVAPDESESVQSSVPEIAAEIEASSEASPSPLATFFWFIFALALGCAGFFLMQIFL